MKIFGKMRDSLRIKRIRASRAMFVNIDVQEVHVEFETEDGDRLVLQMPTRLVPGLMNDLTHSYQAINVPLAHSVNNQAMWEGAGLG